MSCCRIRYENYADIKILVRIIIEKFVCIWKMLSDTTIKNKIILIYLETRIIYSIFQAFYALSQHIAESFANDDMMVDQIKWTYTLV